MDDIQTIDQIESQYTSEWVLIADPQVDEMSRLLAGRVVFHSATKDDVDRKAVELRLPYCEVPTGHHAREYGARPVTFPFDPTQGPVYLVAEVSGPTGRNGDFDSCSTPGRLLA